MSTVDVCVLQAFVMIVCWSWERAQEVYDTLTSLRGAHRSLRAILIHGGGQEENKTVRTPALVITHKLHFVSVVHSNAPNSGHT